MTSIVSDIPKMNSPTEPTKKTSRDEQIDVKTEFKCAIDETLTTVCHVASISDVNPEEQPKNTETGQ